MINIFAPINNLGYGIVANNIIKSLMESQEEICLSIIGQVQSDPSFEHYWKKAQNNFEKFDIKNPSLFLFHDQFSYQACGAPLFVLSMFEGTKIKKDSINILMNGPAEIILTTTEAHKNILQENGITKTIEVVHCGADDSIFNTLPVNKLIDTKKFTFITAGKREERKNTDTIIKSFLEVGEDKEVALICHTFNPFLNNTKDHPFKNLSCWTGINPIGRKFEYQGYKNTYHHFSKDKCDLYFTTPTVPTANMSSLYHSANVGIQASRAEGWDLPLAEMMSCGIKNIATNCLGHSEFINDAPGMKDLIIDNQETEIADDGKWFKGDQGEWQKLDSDKLKEKLSWVLENKSEFGNKDEELSDYMMNNFSWANSVSKIKELCGKYSKE